jgi:hypothetical protein
MVSCRYISKGNLRYLLGAEFPDDEIDAIMLEAESEPGKGISYADFMAQWKADRDEFEERLRKLTDVPTPEHTEMMQEVVVRETSGDAVSNMTFDENMDEDEMIASVNFSERKAVSERKKVQVVWDTAGFM